MMLMLSAPPEYGLDSRCTISHALHDCMALLLNGANRELFVTFAQ